METTETTKYLDEVHSGDKLVIKYGGFIHRFAEHMSVTNMGHNPVNTSFNYFFDDADGAKCMTAEKRGWMRVAKVIFKKFLKDGTTLTIRNADAEFTKDAKTYSALYANKKS